MRRDGRGDGEGFREMNVSTTDAVVPRMSRHWKRPVISPGDGFRVWFWSCKLSGYVWVYTRLHEELRVRESQRGQRKADNAHFKTKAKPHTEDEIEGGLIIFFLSLEGNLGLTWKQPWRRKNLVQPTRRHRQNIWRVLTMGLCVCSVSWSLVPVGLHMHLWASLSLPEWGCASLFACPTACVCVGFVRMPLCACFVCASGRMQVHWLGTSVITGCCWL